jgi:hypothetical protein
MVTAKLQSASLEGENKDDAPDGVQHRQRSESIMVEFLVELFNSFTLLA